MEIEANCHDMEKNPKGHDGHGQKIKMAQESD